MIDLLDIIEKVTTIMVNVISLVCLIKHFRK